MDVGDLSKRIALRNQLRCKGFHWYLKNVFPESVMIAGYQILGQVIFRSNQIEPTLIK